MRRWIAMAGLLLAVAACGGAKTSAAGTTPPAPANEGVMGGDDYGGGSGGTAEGHVNQECLAKCIADNQMRAVSPEQIERDCRGGCTASE